MEPFVLESNKDEPGLLYIRKWMDRYDGVTAGFSSRIGGVSTEEMSSLNCALHVNDKEEHVVLNRKRVTDALDFPFEAWTCAEQVHGNEVMAVTRSERGLGRETRASAIASTDAMITNEPDVLLTAFFADCVPLFFFDPIGRAIGIAHAGWKGTVLRIAQKTVEAMHSQYGSEPQHILAAIGPSIGDCCYEVDETVIGKVREQLSIPDMAHLTKTDSSLIFREADKFSKYMLDLKELNRQFMIKAGILPSNIEISKLCTSCNTSMFFSHRKEQGKTGRMIGWLGLKKG